MSTLKTQPIESVNGLNVAYSLLGEASRAPNWAFTAAGAVLVLVPAAVILARFYFSIRRRMREDQKEERLLLQEEAKVIEQSALDAANTVISHLSGQVECHGEELRQVREEYERRLREAEARERTQVERASKAETELARTRALLQMVALAARQKKVPLPAEIQRLIDEDPSKTHTALEQDDA